MPVINNTQKMSSLNTPSVIGRWRFGGLSAADLLLHLQQYLMATDRQANWQLVWLNNNGRAVIGLLPKVSWALYPNAPKYSDAPDSANTSLDNAALYQIIERCRDSHSCRSENMSYAHWQQKLISYSDYYLNKSSLSKNSLNTNHLNESQSNNSQLNTKNTPCVHTENSDDPSYHHGLIGFIGYDIASQTLSPLSGIKCAAQPAAVLGHYDIYLTGMGDEQGWELHVVPEQIQSDADADANVELNHPQNKAIQAVIECLDTLDTLDNHLLATNLLATNHPQEPTNALAPLLLTATWQKANYQQAFAQTQRYLVQGDCYQINLTQAWQGRLSNTEHNRNSATNLIDYLPALHRNTQAPFAGYISLNKATNNTINSCSDTIGFELLSCSPELFFTFIKDNKTGAHYIRTKPIKGTTPRGINAEQDIALKQQLIDSAKDRAENVMIVDLLRNDLGKYAKTGSVKVPQLFTIESFSNVHHMVSTITAELKADSHPLAVLFGSLPAGSITGTPKKRAVEIIAELEAAPRGAYCGTLGYMNFDGSGQWNVLIRTLQANSLENGEKQVSLWAGGGITIASDCDAEYQECLDKVGNLLHVLAQSDD